MLKGIQPGLAERHGRIPAYRGEGGRIVKSFARAIFIDDGNGGGMGLDHEAKAAKKQDNQEYRNPSTAICLCLRRGVPLPPGIIMIHGLIVLFRNGQGFNS